MTIHAPEAAVAASSFALAVHGMSYDAVLSLVLGLAGVLLARMIFVTRENRASGRPQGWRQTLPLTVLAMLLAGPYIWEHHLSATWAVATGVGIGWSAIVIIELIGRQAIKAVAAFFNLAPPADPVVPPAASPTLDRACPVPDGEADGAQKLLDRLPPDDKA